MRLLRQTEHARASGSADGTIDDIHVTGRGHDIATDFGTIYDAIDVGQEPAPLLQWGSADNDIVITGNFGDTGTGDIGTGLDGLGIVTGNGFNHFDAAWLHHWGHLLPTPMPTPAPMPGLEAPHVTLVGVTHIVHSVFA